MSYLNIREEELKNRVGKDYFNKFDSVQILGDIDFCLKDKKSESYFLWAEAKAGKKDIYESFVQLILTVGKARTFETYLPPSFLGAFDAEKIAFLPYHYVMKIFTQNDFNWNVKPSDHTTKEFRQLYNIAKDILEKESLLFYFKNDNKELKEFIFNNFKKGTEEFHKIVINKNNFIYVYYRWVKSVKPTLCIKWENVKTAGVLDADFYLADLFSEDNITLSENLSVLLQKNRYEFDRTENEEWGTIQVNLVRFNDGQKVHKEFWKRYIRPPKEEYWDYIIKHRDLLVPQDVRERKGSYFTPPQWVELSQKYIADALGENWQDEYYVWDCAAGTGNLLAGLTNKYNIWASTIDQADVDVMKERIANGVNLIKDHVFKFDFLNESFDNLPEMLREIVNDPEKRKKLLIYINPPYAEASNKKQVTGTGESKTGIAKTKVYTKYQPLVGTAARELFAQFLIRIFSEISGCKIAQFSTLKAIQAENFKKFRTVFTAKPMSLFLLPANTFDNVNGQFPIGFFIWDSSLLETKKDTILANVYNSNGDLIGKKTVFCPDNTQLINNWAMLYQDKTSPCIGYLHYTGSDFLHQQYIFIMLEKSIGHYSTNAITANNLMENAVYHAVRHVIPATWLNNRDQFLYPADTWERDTIFQTDCLAYTLFSNSNRISVLQGTNHWIPFTEKEINAQDTFASHFMSNYIHGKIKPERKKGFSEQAQKSSVPTAPLTFSPAAKAVFDIARELWQYYQTKPDANPNAALYDIKEYFQRRNDKGRLKAKSADEQYNRLISVLREKLKILAQQIVPKIYEHGFLK